MQQFTSTFIDSCRVEDGYRLRGESMTRIEVFVDAAFAFAFTMLVISIDQFPNSVPQLIEISKKIPAFVLSALQLMWVWQAHSVWSKRFGLEDGKTVIMSASLVIVVMIFIYPLRMMFSGLFDWISGSYFPSEFTLQNYNELRFLFSYFAVMFIAISLNFLWMYHHVLTLKDKLLLTVEEIFNVQTYIYIRWAITFIGLMAFVTPLIVSDALLPFTGFIYAFIGVAYPLIKSRRNKSWTILNQ